MLGVYLTSLSVVLVSLVLGAGAMRICGYAHPSWAAGALGNAILIVVASVAMRLPGAAVTTLVVTSVALIIAVAALRRERLRPRSVLEAVLVAAIVLALLGLPFLALGHFGLLGVSLDDDLGFHVGWVEQFHAGHAPFGMGPHAYPTGLEALAAVFGGSLRGADRALVGVGAAAPVLSALAALAVLTRAPASVRILGAAAVGLPYLSAAYFGEGSFKEADAGLLVLGLALLSARAPQRRRWWPFGGARDAGWWALGAAPLLVLAAAMYLTLGPGGLVYPAVILLARIVVALARRELPQASARARGLALAGVALACGLAVALVYAAHQNSGLLPFAVGRAGHTHPGGNLARALPLTEGFGVWLGRSFRVPADATPLAPVLVAFALAAVAAGAAVALRARDGTLLVPAIAVLALVLAAREVVIPYDAAKAMVVAGPMLVLTAIAPLASRGAGAGRSHWPALIGPAIAAALALVVLWTSAYSLGSSPVAPDTYDSQLAAMRPLTTGHSVLFLGHDDWLAADLPQAVVETAYPYREFPLPLLPRPQKGRAPPLDFDTEPVAGLDRVQFVITTRTLDASSAPANFSPAMITRDFILWARHGPTAPREVLAERSHPGAILDCHTPAGSRLAARSGVAAIRPVPVIAPPWRRGTGPLAASTRGYAVTPPGGRAYTALRLPAGRWQLSLDYRGPGELTLRVGTATFRVPAQLEPSGSLWAIGDIDVGSAPVPVELRVPRRPAPLPLPLTLTAPLHAVPAGQRDRLVALRAACGRYVDWYRLGT